MYICRYVCMYVNVGRHARMHSQAHLTHAQTHMHAMYVSCTHTLATCFDYIVWACARHRICVYAYNRLH
jgi:hypothetical protein